MAHNWMFDLSLLEAIKQIISQLQIWNNEVFGNMLKKKKNILARLDEIQKALSRHHNRFLSNLAKQLRFEFKDVLL